MSARILPVIFGLVMAVTVGFGRPGWALTTFPPDGPYPVGVILEHGELAGRRAPILVWYPAAAGVGEGYLYPGRLRGAAVENAPPARAGGPYPLILFSHGMGGCGCQSVYYTENLASWGYVVVAPDHRDSAMCRIEGEPDITFGRIAQATLTSGGDLSRTVFVLFRDVFEEIGYDFSYRPREASAAIDLALDWNSDPSHPLAGMIDPERIGVTGHSLGGYTTLMVGGLPFHCENVQLTPEQCDTSSISLHRAISPCCLETVRNASPLQARDPRVKAILPLGPAVFFPDLKRAASELTLPIMIISGGNEKMEVPWEPIETLYQHAPPPKYALRLKKTDHMTVADTTLAMSPVVKLVLPGFRFHYREKAQVYKDYSAAFFDLYLKGDAAKAAILSMPLNRFVELWAQPE